MGEARRKEPARGAPRMVPVKRANDLVTRRDLARALLNYEVWRRRQVWWRRTPATSWRSCGR